MNAFDYSDLLQHSPGLDSQAVQDGSPVTELRPPQPDTVRKARKRKNVSFTYQDATTELAFEDAQVRNANYFVMMKRHHVERTDKQALRDAEAFVRQQLGAPPPDCEQHQSFVHVHKRLTYCDRAVIYSPLLSEFWLATVSARVRQKEQELKERQKKIPTLSASRPSLAQEEAIDGALVGPDLVMDDWPVDFLPYEQNDRPGDTAHDFALQEQSISSIGMGRGRASVELISLNPIRFPWRESSGSRGGIDADMSVMMGSRETPPGHLSLSLGSPTGGFLLGRELAQTRGISHVETDASHSDKATRPGDDRGHLEPHPDLQAEMESLKEDIEDESAQFLQ